MRRRVERITDWVIIKKMTQKSERVWMLLPYVSPPTE